MTQRSENLQPSLFESRDDRASSCVPAQKSELATVIEVLLREIAAALAKAASGESGDDQDHG